MFDHVWPKQVDKAKRIKFLLTRAILSMAAFWVLIALLQIMKICASGMPGQHVPAYFSGSAGMQTYIGGSSITHHDLVLLFLAVWPLYVTLALTALRSLNRSIAGKTSRFASNPKWPTGMQCFVLTFMLCFVAALVAFSVRLHQHPQFPLF